MIAEAPAHNPRVPDCPPCQGLRDPVPPGRAGNGDKPRVPIHFHLNCLNIIPGSFHSLLAAPTRELERPGTGGGLAGVGGHPRACGRGPRGCCRATEWGLTPPGAEHRAGVSRPALARPGPLLWAQIPLAGRGPAQGTTGAPGRVSGLGGRGRARLPGEPPRGPPAGAGPS